MDFLQSLYDATGKRAGESCDWSMIWKLVDKKGLRAILDLSHRWHRTFPGIVSRLLGEADSSSFSFPFAWREAYDGLRVVFLERYSALVEEGLRMSHCVATLYRECIAGETMVFSIRDDDLRSRATFDVRIDEGGRFALNEIRAERNAEPSAACSAVAEQFVKDVNADLRASPEAFRTWRSEVERRPPGVPDHDVDHMVQRAKEVAAIAVLGELDEFDWMVEALRRNEAEMRTRC